MYLILVKSHDGKGHAYHPFFTKDKQQVHEALTSDKNVVVYRIDGLTTVRAMDVNYKEVTDDA